MRARPARITCDSHVRIGWSKITSRQWNEICRALLRSPVMSGWGGQTSHQGNGTELCSHYSPMPPYAISRLWALVNMGFRRDETLRVGVSKLPDMLWVPVRIKLRTPAGLLNGRESSWYTSRDSCRIHIGMFWILQLFARFFALRNVKSDTACRSEWLVGEVWRLRAKDCMGIGGKLP